MDFIVFLRTLVRRWYIVVALVLIGLLGVKVYFMWRGTEQASTTVAVLDPTLARPGFLMQAQIGFDSVLKSHALAERVAARLGDGTSANAVDGAVSVSLSRSLSPAFLSPLYVVKAKDKDKDRAILLANVAVEEARVLFGELNRPADGDVRAAFADEFELAAIDVRLTQDQLAKFQSDNDAFALPVRLAQQASLVSQLRVLLTTSGANGDPAATPVNS
jgi:hypothetical protein